MNTFAIILLPISLLNLFLAVYSLKYRKNVAAFYSFGFLLSIVIHSFGYAFQLSSDNLTDMLFWFRFEFIGIAFLPTFWVMLIIHYIGKESYISKYLKIFCFVFSAFIVGIVFTNQYHGDFYHNANIISIAPVSLLSFTPGIWFEVLQFYIIISLTASIILLYNFFKSGKAFSFQALVLLLVAVLPFASNMVFRAGYSPYGIDLCPFSFSVIGVLYALAILKFQLFDFVPPAIDLVFENLSIGIAIFDNKLCISHINKTLRVIFPHISKSNIGDNVNTVFHSIPSICLIINNENNLTHEIDILVNNEIRHFSVNISDYNNEKARLLGKIIVFVDITERKRSELSLLKSNADKDEFLSIIAHDLKSPFNALINLSEIVTNNNIPEAIREKCIRTINSASRSTYDLFSDLLTWGMAQRGQVYFEIKTIELSTIFNESIISTSFLADNKSITIKTELNQPLYINGDRNMLLTILRNLIANAIKFTNNGGLITLSAIDKTNEVIICVADNGIGMSETEIQNLFRIDVKKSKLGTSQETGNGFGLIICSEFVKKHNGRIWVTSNPGEGSSFFFSIPHNT